MDNVIFAAALSATFVIPLLFARGRHPARAMRRMLVTLLVFDALFVLFLLVVVVRFFVPEWFH